MTKKIEELLIMKPIELTNWLNEEFKIELPDSLEDVEQMKEAGKLLSKTINTYSYLMSMASYAKIAVREKKRDSDKYSKALKQNKDKELEEDLIALSNKAKSEYEDMVDRKESIENAADIANKQYQAISRMITVKKEINTELQMLNMQ